MSIACGNGNTMKSLYIITISYSWKVFSVRVKDKHFDIYFFNVPHSCIHFMGTFQIHEKAENWSTELTNAQYMNNRSQDLPNWAGHILLANENVNYLDNVWTSVAISFFDLPCYFKRIFWGYMFTPFLQERIQLIISNLCQNG